MPISPIGPRFSGLNANAAGRVEITPYAQERYFTGEAMPDEFPSGQKNFGGPHAERHRILETARFKFTCRQDGKTEAKRLLQEFFDYSRPKDARTKPMGTPSAAQATRLADYARTVLRERWNAIQADTLRLAEDIEAQQALMRRQTAKLRRQDGTGDPEALRFQLDNLGQTQALKGATLENLLKAKPIVKKAYNLLRKDPAPTIQVLPDRIVIDANRTARYAP